MPRPSTTLASPRPELSVAVEQFDVEMDRMNFIGHQVARVRNTDYDNGVYPLVKLESILQNKETRRAPRSAYQRGDFEFTTDNYVTEEHGWEEPVDDKEAKLYREYIEAEVWATRRAQDFINRNAERRVRDLLFDTAVFTGAALTTAITTPWSTHATATPLDDVEAAVLKVYAGTGLWPNALVMSRKVFRHLRLCAQVIDNFKSQNFQDVRPGNMNIAHLSTVFDLPYIFVGGGSENTANEGQPRAIDQIWDNDKIQVCRVAITDDFAEPCIARTFHWTGDESLIDGKVESYREEQTRSDIIRVRHDTHEKLIYKECGHLLTNVTA